MVQAGGIPLTWTVFAAELQRDWAREATVADYATKVLIPHMGNVGTSFMWEQQLLNTPSAAKGKVGV
jgi:hypothetical protein